MGFVAEVLEFLRSTVEGVQAPEVKADRGGGDTVTGYHFAAPGDDSQPLAGDPAYFGDDTGTGNAQALAYQDPDSTPKAAAGEKRIYSRSGPGVLACDVWLKADGSVVIENASGSMTLAADGAITLATEAPITIESGNVLLGSSSAAQFVALADLVAAELNILKSAIASAPVAPLDGGATFKAAIVAALAAWPGSVAAGKVKAE